MNKIGLTIAACWILPVIIDNSQTNCNPGQLYNKLFDEVEKIKCWKVKLDSDKVQKERQLQENKRTIETQRKAIQELQVCMSLTTSPFFGLCVCVPQQHSLYIVFVLNWRRMANRSKNYCSTLWYVCCFK